MWKTGVRRERRFSSVVHIRTIPIPTHTRNSSRRVPVDERILEKGAIEAIDRRRPNRITLPRRALRPPTRTRAGWPARAVCVRRPDGARGNPRARSFRCTPDRRPTTWLVYGRYVVREQKGALRPAECRVESRARESGRSPMGSMQYRYRRDLGVRKRAFDERSNQSRRIGHRLPLESATFAQASRLPCFRFTLVLYNSFQKHESQALTVCRDTE